MARVVVTGGAGFIGSHVADAFLARGDDVLVVDDLSTGRRENVPEGAAFERSTSRTPMRSERAFDGRRRRRLPSRRAGERDGLGQRIRSYDCTSNVVGTLNVCEAARRHGAPVVFASTGGALYGDDAPLPTPEDFAPEPLSPYGASKLAARRTSRRGRRLYGMPNVVLRLGNVYGPRQNPHGEAGVVAIFSGLLLAGEQPALRGDGAPTRDYVHVPTSRSAFVLAADGGRAGTYNVGTGRETSTARLLELLQDAAGTAIEPRQRRSSRASSRRARSTRALIERDLGWRATVDVEEGLRQTLDWYRAAHR